MKIFIKLMSSSIAVQIVMILSTLVFSRVFLVENFGELALYASFGSIMAVIGGLRFDFLILKENVQNKIIGFFLSNLVSLFLNLALVLLLFIVQHLAGFFENYSIGILFLFGMGFSVFNNLTQYMISIKSYNNFIKLRLVQVFSVFFIAIFLYITEYKNIALLIAYGGSQLILGLLGFIFIVCHSNNLINGKDIKIFFKENFSESSKNSLISFMQYSTPLVPVIIGSMFFDKKLIGAYFIFAQMISAPLSVIRRNMLIYFNGELSCKQNFNKLFKFYFSKKILAIFLTGNLVILIIVFFFKDDLTFIALGEQWQPYSYLLLPLLFYFIFDCILQPFTTLLPLWGNVNFSLYSEAIRFFLLLFLVPLATLAFNLSFINFILLYIIIMLSVYLIIILKIWKTFSEPMIERGLDCETN